MPTQVQATRRRRSFLGIRKPKPTGRLGEVGGVEAQRYGHRRTVADRAEQLARRGVDGREQARRAVRLAGHHQVVRFQPVALDANAVARRRSARPSARASRTTSACARIACGDRVHQLAEAALEGAEERRGRRLRLWPARARPARRA